MNKKIVIIYIFLIIISLNFNINISGAKESNNDEIPDYVEIGDILFMDFKNDNNPFVQLGPINDHIAIYIGENKFVHSHFLSGVEVQDYNFFKNNYNHLAFGFISTANNSQKLNVADWLKNKVGQKYQYIPKISQKGSDNRWYPAELIWAAYYSQGIDIDVNEWEKPLVVSIQEIIYDLETETYAIHRVPTYLKRGDIIFMDVKDDDTYWAIPGYSNDHAGIYIGPDYKDGNYFIHASSPGVAYIKYDSYHLFFENFTFYYVIDANETEIDSAIKWAEGIIGLKYQCFFPQLSTPHYWYKGMMEMGEKCADPNNKSIKTANRFYCSELVWAAYYNQGIDIDKNGWDKKKPDIQNLTISRFVKLLWKFFGFSFSYVECFDIIDCEKTKERIYQS